MLDWRRTATQTDDRDCQLTGRSVSVGESTQGSIFQGYIDTSGETQTVTMTYSGGSQDMPTPMPFDSLSSWIRAIPEASTPVIAGMRSDTTDVVFLTYANPDSSTRLQEYDGGVSLYRPLLQGEIEIMSKGRASSYYSSRPNLEHRAGVLRSWLDQSRVEIGQKAPLHRRQIWEHVSSEIGDEERFGVVRRPIEYGLLTRAAFAATGKSISQYSGIFDTYPYPDFTLPSGVPAAFGLLGKVIAKVTEAAGSLIGEPKRRPFAKEYLRVINTPFSIAGLFIPPEVLVDVREGQVFDDQGEQVQGDSGNYLRAWYRYYTPFDDATELQIDDLGNVNWVLSLAATKGYSVWVPLGSYEVSASFGVDLSSKTTLSTSSILGTSMTAWTTWDATGYLAVSLESLFSMSETVDLGLHSVDALLSTHTTELSHTITTGSFLEVYSSTYAQIMAPQLFLGAMPSMPAALGGNLAIWLAKLCKLLSTPNISMSGNLGCPVPINPVIVAGLEALTAEIPKLVSATIFLDKTSTAG